MTHSPLPWSVSGHGDILDATGECFVGVAFRGAEEERRQNAALIVEACNCHGYYPGKLDTPPSSATIPAIEMQETPMTRKRFEYVKMTAQEFSDALADIDLHPHAFARLTGSLAERVNKWVFGGEEIPQWVPGLMAALTASPEALVALRREAAARIIYDNQYRDRGQFPYMKGAKFDDND